MRMDEQLWVVLKVEARLRLFQDEDDVGEGK
jgi:hypothetical protein